MIFYVQILKTSLGMVAPDVEIDDGKGKKHIYIYLDM